MILNRERGLYLNIKGKRNNYKEMMRMIKHLARKGALISRLYYRCAKMTGIISTLVLWYYFLSTAYNIVQLISDLNIIWPYIDREPDTLSVKL